jgi:hypothetical protein
MAKTISIARTKRIIEDPMVEVAIMPKILSPSFGSALRYVKS